MSSRLTVDKRQSVLDERNTNNNMFGEELDREFSSMGQEINQIIENIEASQFSYETDSLQLEKGVLTV